MNATQELERAWHAAGLDRVGGKIAHWSVTDVEHQSPQSARASPPSFSIAVARQIWFDPASGTERMTSRLTGLVAGDAQPMTTITNGRPLNVWAVLVDWRQSGAARVVGRTTDRDYHRLILERPSAFGPERLYLDSRTHLPVKLEREEKDDRRGHLRAQYEYRDWTDDDATAHHPRGVVRLIDGQLDVERVEQEFDLVSADCVTPVSPVIHAN
ncbi:MAG: hypothetical protein ABIY52_09340 [Gemmatimonadaceae bacterium]